MNILQKLLENITLYEEDKITNNELIIVQNQYLAKIKYLENEYNIAKTFKEKNKISKKIEKLTDRRILIMDD